MKQVNRATLSLRELSLIIINQMQAGKNRQEMTAYLRQRGWPDASARHFIANVLAQNPAAAHADAGADTNDLQPAQESHDAHDHSSAALLWATALIGLTLIGLNLISNLAP